MPSAAEGLHVAALQPAERCPTACEIRNVANDPSGLHLRPSDFWPRFPVRLPCCLEHKARCRGLAEWLTGKDSSAFLVRSSQEQGQCPYSDYIVSRKEDQQHLKA